MTGEPLSCYCCYDAEAAKRLLSLLQKGEATRGLESPARRMELSRAGILVWKAPSSVTK
jgi:hypothetical protein